MQVKKLLIIAPPNLGFAEFEAYMDGIDKIVGVASRNYRMIQTPEFDDEKDTIGDVFTLKSFIGNVKSGGFIDYDGFGVYSKDGVSSNITIYPSDVKHNSIRKDFKEIIWYNR